MRVIATTKGYFGAVVRELGDGFDVPDEIWNDPKRRPSWAKLDPSPAFDHDGGGKVGGSLPHAGGKPEGITSIVVPADWSSLHHSKRKALAKIISGAAVADLDEADKIIAAYVEANKSAPFSDAPEPQTVAQAMKAIGATQPDWIDPSAPKAVAD